MANNWLKIANASPLQKLRTVFLLLTVLFQVLSSFQWNILTSQLNVVFFLVLQRKKILCI